MELTIIFLSLGIATLIPLLSKKQIFSEGISLLASLLAFIASLFLAFRVSESGTYAPNSFLSVDALGALILLIVATVALATTGYSIRYFREEVKKKIIGPTRVRQYFLLTNLFCIATFLAIVSGNPIFTWIFLEATTLSTCFLISFYNKASTVEAAWKYLVINSVGLLLGFFGTLLFLTAVGSQEGSHFVTWNDLLLNASHLDPTIAKIAFIFVLIGYGTKIGLAPLHTWKPDAYSKSPAPVGALLSGMILPVAFMVLLKFRVLTNLAVDSTFTEHLFLFFGIFSVLTATLILLTTRNYKRLLAYSSIEHAGLMLLGFAFGGAAIFATLLHMLFHSLIKASAFFLSGNILLRFSSARILNVSGAIIAIPTTAVLFLLVFLAASGLPPFGTFFTKLTILTVGIQMHPLITLLALLAMTLLIIGFLKNALSMLFGKKPEAVPTDKEDIWLLLPSILLLSLVILLGFSLPTFLFHLITAAATHYQ